MGFEQNFEILSCVLDVLIIIASGLFLYSFIKLSDKNYGLYMILILNISDLIYPVMNLLVTICVKSQFSANIFAAFSEFLFGFGLYWSTFIAILIYTVLNWRAIVNPKLYMITAFSVSVGVILPLFFIILFNACGVQVMYYQPGAIAMFYPTSGVSDQIAYFLIFDVLGRMVPISITSFCYYKVFQKLSSSLENNLSSSKINRVRVLSYSLIQIVCFIPGMIGDIIFMSQGARYSNELVVVVSTLHRCWGIFNLLAYWFLRPKEKIDLQKQSLAQTYQASELSLTVVSNF